MGDLSTVLGSPEIIRESLRDSTRWDRVLPRPDDIVIASCYKAGTTLAQQIVNLLLNGEREFRYMGELSPWVESVRHGPDAASLEALVSRRFFKTHLHPAALPWREDWKYLYLARDGRDVGLSLYNHVCKIERERQALGLTKAADLSEFGEFWDRWVEDGTPRWDFWHNVAGWWRVRERHNVLLLHYADLLRDKAGVAQQIAAFLGCPWDADIAARVCRGSSLESMRELEMRGRFGSTDPQKKQASLVHKGVNGRWLGLLNDARLRRYETLAEQRLEPQCVAWLRQGGEPAGSWES